VGRNFFIRNCKKEIRLHGIGGLRGRKKAENRRGISSIYNPCENGGDVLGKGLIPTVSRCLWKKSKENYRGQCESKTLEARKRKRKEKISVFYSWVGVAYLPCDGGKRGSRRYLIGKDETGKANKAIS